MNDELQKQLAAMIEGFLSTASEAKSFALAEMPEVIRQFIAWKVASDIAILVLSAVCLLLSYFPVKYVFKIKPGSYKDNSNWAWNCYKGLEEVSLSGGFIVFVFCGIVAGLSLSAAVGSGMELLKIWAAPKVFLLEYAAHLVK